MDGSDFLTIARELAQGVSEAHRRAACGRAYYALMLESRDALRRWGFAIPPRDQVHTFVRLRFDYAKNSDAKAIGAALEWLKWLRNRADYQLVAIVDFNTPKLMLQAIQEAQMALALLDQIDRDVSRRQTVIASIHAAGF